jgi:hypothetical protein
VAGNEAGREEDHSEEEIEAECDENWVRHGPPEQARGSYPAHRWRKATAAVSEVHSLA